MNNFLSYMCLVLMMLIIFAIGLKACEYEYQMDVAKSKQWHEDIKNGKPYTNYGE